MRPLDFLYACIASVNSSSAAVQLRSQVLGSTNRRLVLARRAWAPPRARALACAFDPRAGSSEGGAEIRAPAVVVAEIMGAPSWGSLAVPQRAARPGVS